MLATNMSAWAQDVFRKMSYSPKQTVFYLNSPKRPTLSLWSEGLGGQPLRTVKMRADGKNRWKATVKGDLKGQFYTFNIGRGDTPGVFAKAVGVNGQRGAIIDLRQTDPEGWADDHRLTTHSPADLVIYEMHHRDFSIASHAAHPGKFLALSEPWSLGVNAVHILPSFDFASVDETKLDKPQYNWGYDPLNYNVPEGSYSTDPYTPATRIREFKKMVQALHKAGIRVILDVVYNHTFDLDNSNFQRTYPDYYYRFTKDGKPSNGSGCGNETASEKPLMREFMLESVKYWATEYHIDGFRFDLMGVHDIPTMNAIRQELTALDPNIFIYGEGWSAGNCALPNDRLAMKANMKQMPGIAAFCDDLRDAVRGPFSDDHKPAFLAGMPGSEESIKAGITGMIAHPQVDYTKVNYSKEPWATEPTQMIAYVSCHDDMCLVDRLKASIPNITSSELQALDKLAQTIVFTSQGVPFMLSGEELLRDKKGVHNSFNSPDSINALDWGNLQRYPGVTDYYRRLIASWSNIYVIFNGNRETRTITLPEGTYRVVCQNGQIDETGLTILPGGDVKVSGQSAMIMVK